MTDNVVRFADYERRSRDPDAHAERRDPSSATIIILPTVKVEQYGELAPSEITVTPVR